MKPNCPAKATTTMIMLAFGAHLLLFFVPCLGLLAYIFVPYAYARSIYNFLLKVLCVMCPTSFHPCRA